MKVGNVHHYGLDPALWPAGAVYIARATKGLAGSPLGNPYHLLEGGDRDLVVQQYRVWLHACLRSPLRFREQVNELARLAWLNPPELLCWCAPKACHGDVVCRALAWWRGTMRHVAVVGARRKKWADPQATVRLVNDLVLALPHDVCVVSGHANGVDRWAEDTQYSASRPVWSMPVSDAAWRADPWGAGFARNTEIVAGVQAVIAVYNGRDGGTHDTVEKALAAKLPVITVIPDPERPWDFAPFWPKIKAMLADLPPVAQWTPPMYGGSLQ